MARLILGVALAGMLATSAAGQSPPRPPVIDVHVHSPNTSGQQALERMKSLNIRHMLVASLAADLPAWAAAVDASQFTPSLVLPCAGGRANITGRPCWEGATDFPDLSWLRDEIRAGRIKALGELTPQYMGISPQDSRLEPYWQLAEELDLPIGIHMGPGPPGAAYESSPAPVKSPKRIMFGSDFAEQVGPGIDAIVGADFLSAEQKADILCNNAARFLRLNASVCSS